MHDATPLKVYMEAQIQALLARVTILETENSKLSALHSTPGAAASDADSDGTVLVVQLDCVCMRVVQPACVRSNIRVIQTTCELSIQATRTRFYSTVCPGRSELI
jgi:hypothetical protein